MSLIAELKRRNVIRAAVLYVFAAWLTLQVTEVLSSLLPLPQWIGPLVVALLALAFPLVVIFSWVYELTPEGFKREKDVNRGESIVHLTARKLDVITMIVAGAVVVMVLVDRLIPRAELEVPIAVTRDPLGQAAPTLGAATDRSIAVLPFVNISADPEQEYFSDGLSEELLNLLARIPDLRVAARTSAFSFRGKDVQIPVVARELNVSYVLEGSVRRSGDRLRVSARLVRADSGYQLWSETYDRHLDDIFVVQEEIATNVVRNLNLALVDGTHPIRAAPHDTEAYTLYLQGRYLAGRRSRENYSRAVDYYQQALALEPSYALASVGLAYVYANQAGSGYVGLDEGIARARAAVERTLAFDPTLAEAYAVMGWIQRVYDWDWTAAEESLTRARQLDPRNAYALRNAGVLAATLGRFDVAIDLFHQALTRDPLMAPTHVSLGLARFYAGRLADAEVAFRKALALSPESGGTRFFLGRVLLANGESEAALETMNEEPDDVWRLAGLPLAYHALGRESESYAAMAELTDRFATIAAFQIAQAHAYRGEIDQAFTWLDRAYQQRDGGLSEIMGDPMLRNLESDPRYSAFLRRMRLMD